MACADTLNPHLRDSQRDEVQRLRDNKDFGLMFERHLRRSVRLWTHPVKRGVKVPDRGTRGGPTWTARQMSGRRRDLGRWEAGEITHDRKRVAGLVVVA